MDTKYKYLRKIDAPSDLKKFKDEELIEISKELREYIIDVVSGNPGHFASSLGVVELTVALHYVYNSPSDKIIWDVGHQAYGHKILTGRRDFFHTNRKLGGISGFPVRSESPHDAFGVGHSSTSVSAGLGMAVAAALSKQDKQHVIAVIGDGALTGGLAFEGLNNAGSQNADILVILNDNNMSIDPNVGAVHDYLVDISTSKTYNKVKDEVWNVLGKIRKIGPNTRKLIQVIESGIKSVIMRQSNMFEAMNFRYFGPVNGHDVNHLVSVLNDLKNIKGPKLLHIATVKGKGFKAAESDQTGWHAPGLFDKNTGKKIKPENSENLPPKFQEVFGITLTELAKNNPKIVGVTPAMPSGSSMNIMMRTMPERVFDVGIAEQHAVTFSAGLAANGMTPFCNIYSTFMQRAYDQVIHDTALQKLNVVFCLDRGGLVGDDGPTHHGAFDLAYMRSVPNLTIAAPMDQDELRNLMYTAQLPDNGTFIIRYPRGRTNAPFKTGSFRKIPAGKGRKLRSGKDIAILTAGKPGVMAAEACEILAQKGLDAAHYDMRFVKPLDTKILHKVFKSFPNVITVEDGAITGGFGSAVIEFMADNNYSSKVVRLGIPDKFIEHGKQEQLYKICGFDTDGIVKTALRLQKKSNTKFTGSDILKKYLP